MRRAPPRALLGRCLSTAAAPKNVLSIQSHVVYGAAGIGLTAVWAAVGRDAPATPDLCVPDECPLPDEAEDRQLSATSGRPAAGTASETAWERAAALPWGEEFDFPTARELFGSNLLVLTWIKGEPLPAELVEDILKSIGLARLSVWKRQFCDDDDDG